jgi:hypothetical protein
VPVVAHAGVAPFIGLLHAGSGSRRRREQTTTRPMGCGATPSRATPTAQPYPLSRRRPSSCDKSSPAPREFGAAFCYRIATLLLSYRAPAGRVPMVRTVHALGTMITTTSPEATALSLMGLRTGDLTTSDDAIRGSSRRNIAVMSARCARNPSDGTADLYRRWDSRRGSHGVPRSVSIDVPRRKSPRLLDLCARTADSAVVTDVEHIALQSVLILTQLRGAGQWHDRTRDVNAHAGRDSGGRRGVAI